MSKQIVDDIHKFIEFIEALPMDRSNLRASIKVIKEAASRLRQGVSIVIFPEGTRAKNGNQITLDQKKYNKNNQVVESVDSNNIKCIMTYDKYGNVLIEKILGNDSKYILKEYTYNKMLLLTEKTYINGVASIVTYTRNSNTGNVEKITYPDGLEVDYTYYDSTNGKLNKLSATVDSVVNSNTLSYINDKPSNYKGMNGGHSLTYDRFNMPAIHKNGNNIIFENTNNISTDGLISITKFTQTNGT